MSYYAWEEEYKAEKIAKDFEKAVKVALLDLDDGFCQAFCDKYVTYATAFLDKETITHDGEEIPMDKIVEYLETVENNAGIEDSLKFRLDVTRQYYREMARIDRANHEKAPEDRQPVVVNWLAIEGMREMVNAQFIEKVDFRRMLSSFPDMTTEEQTRLRERLYENMDKQGYDDRKRIDHVLQTATARAKLSRSDKYIAYAEALLDAEPLFEDGKEISKGDILEYLETVEKNAGIMDPFEFRRDVTRNYHRDMARAHVNQGQAPEGPQPA